jgi:hypothetical protein
MKPRFSLNLSQFYLPFVLIILAFASACTYPEKVQGNGNEMAPQFTEASELRYSLTHNKTLGESWDGYYDLSNSQRRAVWADKLAHSRGFFTGQQDELDFLDNAMDGLEDEDFDEESGIDDTDIVSEAQLIFSDSEIFKVFMVLHDYDDTPDPWRPNVGDPQPDCVCRWSMGCGSGLCEHLGCTSTVSGCGFLWLSSCSGICDNSPF